MAAAAPIASGADPDLPERLFGEDQARAYRRYLEWSVGYGFRLAIVTLTSPAERDALVAWTAERFPGAIHTSLVGAVNRPLIPFLEEACPEPPSASVLLLTGLDDAPERVKLCARINIQRDELAQAFPLPWVLLVHPATAMDLRMSAPDFSDFATLWVREAKPPVAALPIEPRSVELQRETIVLSTAGEGAERLGLLAQAETAIELSQYDHAADLLARYDLHAPQAEARDPLRTRLEGLLLARRGRPLEALACFEAALGRCKKTGDDEQRAVLLSDIASVRAGLGELDEALRIWREEVLPAFAFKRRGDVRSFAVTADEVAAIYKRRGELDEALHIWRDTLPIYERLGDVRSRAVTMDRIAEVYFERGEREEALRIWREETLPVYERLGDVRARAMVMGQIAEVHRARGELSEALRIWREEALPVYARLGDVRARAVAMDRIADIAEARGELSEALRIWREEALPVYQRLGDDHSRAATMVRIAGVHKARGEIEEALHLLREEALPAYERLGDARGLISARVHLASLYLTRGRPEERALAADLLRLALQQAEAMRLPEAEQIRAFQRAHGLESQPGLPGEG